MLNIAICDDDTAERARTRALLDDFLVSRGLAARAREFAAGKELLFDLDGGGSYDLYLLDVVMPEMNGIELGCKIRETDEDGEIIYLTTSEDFAVDSYEARAFWYLVKPVKPDKLYPVLDRVAAALQRRRNEGVNVRTRRGTVRLPFDEIYYAEAAERAVRYVCKSGVVEGAADPASFCKKAAPLLADARFRLCGASLVLNLHHIKTVEASAVALRTGERLEVPRRAAAELRDAWTSYWLEGGG